MNYTNAGAEWTATKEQRARIDVEIAHLEWHELGNVDAPMKKWRW